MSCIVPSLEVSTSIYRSTTIKLEVYDFLHFLILTSALATTHPPTQILTVLGLRKPYEILDDPLLHEKSCTLHIQSYDRKSSFPLLDSIMQAFGASPCNIFSALGFAADFALWQKKC